MNHYLDSGNEYVDAMEYGLSFLIDDSNFSFFGICNNPQVEGKSKRINQINTNKIHHQDPEY